MVQYLSVEVAHQPFERNLRRQGLVSGLGIPTALCGVRQVGGVHMCVNANRSLPTIGAPRCHRCGNPGPNPCLCIADATRVWPLDGMRSAFEFESPVREAILALKYANLRSVAGTLSGYVADMVIQDGLEFDLLAPVPLHKRRLRQRGYNQAQIIAQHLGQGIGSGGG